MSSFKNKNVLITGGASGIGKIMARRSLEKGAACVVIWDISKEAMERTKEELQCLGRVEIFKVNVCSDEEIKAAYLEVKKIVGQVDILINNAGVVRGNSLFHDNTAQDIDLTMDVNATAPMKVALAIMPDMVKRNSGHICNVASAAGMLGVPKLSVYCASKWAVVGWSESVRIELKMCSSNVKVCCVAPYFINTGMFDGVKSKVFPILEPEKAARGILRAVEKDKFFCGLPFGFHFIRFWQAVLPRFIFDPLFGKLFGIYEVMDHFTGRKKA